MPVVPLHPILVVSYVDETRAALTSILSGSGVSSAVCTSFCEAENLAIRGLYSGLLVDLPSIIKSKGEEKIVAYTLTNFFPTLRVRTIGSMLVPMAMPGSAKQDKSLGDFLNVTCPSNTPRKLRLFRRHPVYISTLIHYDGAEYRGFTLNLSWGGAFIVDLIPEKFAHETDVTISIPELGFNLAASIRWIKSWGNRHAPGVGISFNKLSDREESTFSIILKSSKEFDRDRLTA
ncbi:MAG: PilZ domain-containing protein [Desulfuromonadales bacterium]